MEGSGREWKGVEGSGREWKGVEGSGREWKGVEGSGREWKGVEGSGSSCSQPAHWNGSCYFREWVIIMQVLDIEND